MCYTAYNICNIKHIYYITHNMLYILCYNMLIYINLYIDLYIYIYKSGC